jgi:hypothetical protein
MNSRQREIAADLVPFHCWLLAGVKSFTSLLPEPVKNCMESGLVGTSEHLGCGMTILPRGRRRGIGAAAVVIAAVGSGIAISGPTPAAARVFVGFGFGFPVGFPGYYYPPYPYPYYPPPPSPYYYPPLPGYPPPASYQPSGYPPSAGSGPSGSSAAPPITYTPRPGWTNAQGQYCREYKSTQSTGRSATERYGTACRDTDGQWRIVN